MVCIVNSAIHDELQPPHHWKHFIIQLIGKTRIFGKFLDGGGVVYVCVYNFKVNYFLLTTFDILKKLVNPIWNFVKIYPIW